MGKKKKDSDKLEQKVNQWLEGTLVQLHLERGGLFDVSGKHYFCKALDPFSA